MIASTISHYKITEKLGEGGMGEVYLAEDTTLKRKVALKFLPEHLHQDELARKRFLREAESAAALDHPYICHINEVSQTETGQDFIVMEYVEGQTLQEKLEEGPLSLEETIRMCKEIADALALAHQRGIVHRDLKPANIMLTLQGHAKVMDFGLAKRIVTENGTEQDLTSGLTREGSTLGTPAYMSPEQVRAQQVDHRTDIFSFGIILYEMLTGTHPFRRTRPVETMGAILHEEPEPLNERFPGATELLQQTVNQLLAKNPDERIQTIEEVANRLSQLQTEELRLMAFLRSCLGKRLTLALIALIAIALIGWWALRQQPTDVGGPILSSIAVLPLENLSGDPEQDFFVDGMTDALITDLSKIGALQVIARHSAMRYKETDKPLSEIAQELNVEGVVRGSVQREADQVQIAAQLTVAATGQDLWSESYERKLTSILVLHGEVAQAIAREIQVTLTPEEETLLTPTRQVNPDAYEACLKARFHIDKLTGPDLEMALQYCELALEKDPNYAPAYAFSAIVWNAMPGFGYVPIGEAGPKAREAALKAIELDETCAKAHSALGMVRTFTDYDWEGAEAAFLRGIELNPNDGRVGYCAFLRVMARPDEAMVQIEKALKLDPHRENPRCQYALVLTSMDRYDDAIEVYRSVLRTVQNHPIALSELEALFYAKGMYEEALKFGKAVAAVKQLPGVEEAMVQGYEEAGYLGAYRRAAEAAVALSSGEAHGPRQMVAWYYTAAKEKQKALDWLERGVEERRLGPGFWDSLAFKTLHDEPRFRDLLRRMNFPEDVIARILDDTE